MMGLEEERAPHVTPAAQTTHRTLRGCDISWRTGVRQASRPQASQPGRAGTLCPPDCFICTWQTRQANNTSVTQASGDPPRP